MARSKNADTQHYISEFNEDIEAEEVEWLRLAKWISLVGDESDEETEDTAWYDGDGTTVTDVISIKKNHPFEGLYDDSDEAHKFLRSLEFETGEGRKILYKQIRSNGDELVAPATVKEIITTGGEADEYAPIEGEITWDRKPTITSEIAAYGAKGTTTHTQGLKNETTKGGDVKGNI